MNIARLESNPGSLTRGIPFFSLVERPIAFVSLAIAAPILIATGCAVWILSRRSPLVAHRRVGQFGRKFWLFKIRTMWDGGQDPRALPRLVEFVRQDPVSSGKPVRDPRVTSRFAIFLRKYSIDELPQLANVLLGDMSLVGPRPLTQGELAEHYGADQLEVLSIKPGITGLWQTMGRSRLTYRQRLRLDLFLARKGSAGLCLRVLLRTIPRVLTGVDAW